MGRFARMERLLFPRNVPGVNEATGVEFARMKRCFFRGTEGQGFAEIRVEAESPAGIARLPRSSSGRPIAGAASSLPGHTPPIAGSPLRLPGVSPPRQPCRQTGEKARPARPGNRWKNLGSRREARPSESAPSAKRRICKPRRTVPPGARFPNVKRSHTPSFFKVSACSATSPRGKIHRAKGSAGDLRQYVAKALRPRAQIGFRGARCRGRNLTDQFFHSGEDLQRTIF